MSSIEAALATGVAAVTKSWKEAKRQADRNDRVRRRDLERMRRWRREEEWTLKAAAYEVMAEAYRKASDNGRYPANARQIMYAARPMVLKLTEGGRKEMWKKSNYFTQTLLPNYIEEHPDETADWDVIFDARGHFREPHTGEAFGIGTEEVREYRGKWRHRVDQGLGLDEELANRLIRVPTKGPANRYRAVLFIEKEGFDPLWERVDLADRFDLGIMSTKGMSTTAARSLVVELSAQGVPVYVLRDFDKAGFSIVHTMRTDTRRFRFAGRPTVIDLGLRLADVEAMGLESEPVDYGRAKADPRRNLRASGATEAECDFLVEAGGDWYEGWAGQRVELNAMDSRQLVEWVEGKLADAGVRKVVPDDDALANAYQRARRLTSLRRAIAEALRQEKVGDDVPVPDDLRQRVEEQLEDDATLAWDDVVAEIAAEAEEPEPHPDAGEASSTAPEPDGSFYKSGGAPDREDDG